MVNQSKLEAKNFNKEWAEKVGKDKFVKAHQHLAKHSELEDLYNEVVPPKAKKPTE